MARFPWLTCCLVSSALLASLLPGLGGALEFARAPIGNGEIWRLVSGQLVHWTPRMALLDLGAVLILGVWVERRSRILAVAVTSGGMSCEVGRRQILTLGRVHPTPCVGGWVWSSRDADLSYWSLPVQPRDTDTDTAQSRVTTYDTVYRQLGD